MQGRLQCIFGYLLSSILSMSLFTSTGLLFLLKYDEVTYKADDMVMYRKDTPLIWIGGVPRSGTTLLRVLLDTHPDVRCGPETRVIPRLLTLDNDFDANGVEKRRLDDANVTRDVLDDALGAYILTIVSRHGAMAPMLCNKDPFSARAMVRLTTIFPNSKFLLMVRDGRATCHSIISRHVTINHFNITDYKACLRDWNREMTKMVEQCTQVGHKCLRVYYEQLVLHPRLEMEHITEFLDIQWNEDVLRHERIMAQTDGIALSHNEMSTDQVDKPINTAALTAWVEYIPHRLRQEMADVAPMLSSLGYDLNEYPPKYGTPDEEVVANNDQVKGKLNEKGLIGKLRIPIRDMKAGKFVSGPQRAKSR